MNSIALPQEHIESRIYVIRSKKVMLDTDLAELYAVATKVLKQAVRRNIERFPGDFMFELSQDEARNLRSQIVTSSSGWGGARYMPWAFTEHGVAMLSCVLRSERAVSVSIQIIRAFMKLREMVMDHSALNHRLDLLEKQYDEQFKIVFDAMRRLLDDQALPPSEIGFRG